MKKYAYIYSLLIWFFIGSANNLMAQNVNSLEVLEAKKQSNEKMFILINSANEQMLTKPKHAFILLEKALKLAYQEENKRGEAFSYQSLGAVQYKLEHYRDAAKYYEKAELIFIDIKEEKAYYLVLKQKGLAYEAAKEYKRAAKAYKLFLEKALALGKTQDAEEVKENLARNYFNQGAFSLAKPLYQEALVLYKTRKDSLRIIEIYGLLGKTYAGMRDTAMAMKYLSLAANVTDVSNENIRHQQSDNWENVSKNYNSIGKYSKSNTYEKKAYKYNKKTKGRSKELIDNSLIIGNNYILMDNTTEAIPYLEESVNLAQEMGELKANGQAYKALSKAYAQMGEMEKARANFDAYARLQEKVLEAKELAIMNLDKVDNSLFEKEKQIALLVETKELDEKRIDLLEEQQSLRNDKMQAQRNYLYILIAIAFLLLLGLGLLYRSSKQKQIANKLLSIRSLQSQMNPHFIFNSLNSVNSFISQNDERSANKYLTEFARLMRLVLDHSKKDFVSLTYEIAVLKKYLSLEHLRFKDQFVYQFNIDKSLPTDEIMIPPMMVQPFIENAIWHGLRYKKEMGSLKVEFIDDGKFLKIIIEDDGIGIAASHEYKTKNQKQNKSTGISNTQGRLSLLNEVHRTTIKSTIASLNADGSGTQVVIKMNKIFSTEENYV